jgi:hypothetical protein
VTGFWGKPFSNKGQIVVRVLFALILFCGLTAFELERNLIAISFALSLILLHSLAGSSRKLRGWTFALSLFFVSSMWSYRLEGKYFGEGFWAHVGTGNFVYLLVYKKCVVFSLLFYAFTPLLLKKQRDPSLRWQRGLGALTAVFLIGGPLATTMNTFKIFVGKKFSAKAANMDGKSPIQNGEYFFKNNTHVKTLANKNIIFIVMESIEKEYTNEAKYPGLMPNFQALKKEGLFFTNFQQQPGAFTTGGLLASTCGVYITALSDSVFGNDVLQEVPTNRLNCLGDLLGQAGWDSYFFQGTDLRFSNLGRIFTDHDTKVFGVERFDEKEQHQAGAYDYYLFRNLKSFIDDMDDEGDEPFFLTFINYDTHGPGFKGPGCEPYDTNNDVVQSVHCYDKYLGDFVSYLKKSPIWKDSVVFIFNDHLSMTNFQNMGPEERRNVLLILNAGQGEVSERIYHIDIPKIASDFVLQGNKSFPLSLDVLKNAKADRAEFDDEFTLRLVDFIGKNLQ